MTKKQGQSTGFLQAFVPDVSRRHQFRRAVIVLILVTGLVTLQMAFLSVVVDAVDPKYLKSDRYHITAEYLISISEILFASAIAIQIGSLIGYLPGFHPSLNAYIATFMLCFIGAWMVVDDIREWGINKFLASRSTEDRRLSALVAINQMALLQDGMDFEEVDLGFDDLATPDAKITVFLSPVIFYLAGIDKLNETSDEKIDALLRTVDEENIATRIEQAVTEETQEYCDTFEETYAEYTFSVNEGVKKISELSGGGLGSDRVYQAASQYYFNTINDKLGRGWAVLPGLTREQFINHRDLQNFMKSRFRENLPELRKRAQEANFPEVRLTALSHVAEAINRSDQFIDPCSIDENLMERISSGMQKDMRGMVKSALNPETTSLGVGGEHEDYGRTALEIAVLPTLSITALLIGMVLNGRGAILQIASGTIGRNNVVGGICVIAFLGTAAVWPFLRTHDQLDRGSVKALMADIENERGMVTRYGVEWVLRTASRLYYVGHDIRTQFDIGMMGLDANISKNLLDDSLELGLSPEGLTDQ